MKIKSIFVFIKLAENGCDFNVHKILGIPRSSMWTYISDLERTLGSVVKLSSPTLRGI